MNCYNIAGITVGYTPRYDVLKERSLPYLAKNGEKPHFTINLSHEMIESWQAKNPKLAIEWAEYLLVGQLFYLGLIRYGGILLHSSTVVVDGFAYCFSANSGTGKSTHTALWLEAFKDKKPYILNDDKPALIFRGGKVYACGTPFSGKHDISVNTAVPVKSICFIERSEKNEINKIDSKRAVKEIFWQTAYRADEKFLDQICNLIGKIVDCIPVYCLRCNMEIEAAKIAYDEMSV